MKKYILTLIAYSVTVYGVVAQRMNSAPFVQFGAGVSTYFGDLQKDNLSMKPGFEFGIGKMYQNGLGVKANILFSSADGQKDNKSSAGVLRSKESFYTSFNEFSIQASKTIFPFNRSTHISDRFYENLSVYGFAGVGLTLYSSRHLIDIADASKVIETRTNAVTPVIPIGLGVSYRVYRDFYVGVEGGGRILFTDKFDSREGKTKKNDFYTFFSLSIAKTIHPQKTKYHNSGRGESYLFGQLSGGPIHYFGDLRGGNSKSGFRTGVSFAIGYLFGKGFSIKANALIGNMGAEKTNFKKAINEVTTETFDSKINEFSLIGSWSFLRLPHARVPGAINNTSIAMYVFAGIGVLQYETSGLEIFKATNIVRTTYVNQPKQKTTPIVPVGLGVRYGFIKNLYLHAEFGYRFTQSDDLDARVGKTKKNDYYSFTNLGITYLFGGFQRRGGMMSCPRF